MIQLSNACQKCGLHLTIVTYARRGQHMVSSAGCVHDPSPGACPSSLAERRAMIAPGRNIAGKRACKRRGEGVQRSLRVKEGFKCSSEDYCSPVLRYVF